VQTNRYLGIDLGGTKTALALANPKGEIVAAHRFPTNPSRDTEADLERLVAHITDFLKREKVGGKRLVSVGVSAPGPLDPERGILLSAPNLPGWKNVPLASVIESALHVPARLENDANAAALAEWRFGAGQGSKNMIYLTMSTGIGGGLVLDGRIYRGEACSAGELGHVPVEWDGEPCNCGQRGCLEAYIGGAAWQKYLRGITPDTSQVFTLANGRENVRPEHLVQAARAGDTFALAEMKRFNGYLIKSLVGLTFTLAPEVIVLGTIAVAAGEELCIGPVAKEVRKRVWPHFQKSLRILPAALGDDLPRLAGICVAMDVPID